MRHRKVQCVKPAARPGGDDVQADFKACKGRVPKQKEDCTDDRPCKTMCPKRSRKSEMLFDDKANIDELVDIGLSKYLEQGENKAIDDSAKPLDDGNVEVDLKNLLRELVQDDKKKRTCNSGNNLLRPIEENIEFRKFTTPKPGSIIQDHNPADTAVLYEVPVKEDSQKSNLSDIAFHEIGDLAPVALDTNRQTVYKGDEAVKRIHEMANVNVTWSPGNSRSDNRNSDNNYADVK